MNLRFCALAVLGLSVAGCHQTGIVSRENGGTFIVKNLETTYASGQRTRLFFNAAINPDCSPAPREKVRVVDPPKHGSITLVPGSDYPYFVASNPRSACNTRRVEGEFVYYTPDANYTGEDRFTYEGYLPTGGGGRVNMLAHIR